MQTEEQQYVLDNLAHSQDHLLALTAHLTPAQWDFRESPQRWSIRENVEHCILTERAITGAVRRALSIPAQPEKRAAAPAKEAHVKGVDRVNGKGLQALEVLCPTGRWPDSAELLATLKSLRAQSMDFVRTLEGDLREHFHPHQELGDLDAYQWLVIMALHGERHARQIERVQAAPGYPAA